ncbi:MAG TPA: SRPBCC family protein [Streptosporangiaceae bacterium]|nr:SRPBCC family protein [Streptosporangiaceae bacterium]
MTTRQEEVQDQRRDDGDGSLQELGDTLKTEVQNLLGELADLAITAARDTIGGATQRLIEYAEQGGGPGLVAAVTGAKNMAEGKGPVRSMLPAGWSGLKQKLGGGGGKTGQGGKGQKKVTSIIETIDVGVPVRLAYNQWTQYSDFPSFMKKVESVNQEDEVKASWRAQVFWSHRSWESNILLQRPDECIVWRSKGSKGHVDGAVTFHELAPNLTRIVLVLEYFPQGLFEQTGNLWRAQGRRARLELKHFRRHMMSHAILDPEEIEGWRGVIEDGEVVQSHEDRVREEHGEGDQAQAEPGDGEKPAGDKEARYTEDEDYADEYPNGAEARGDEDAEDEYLDDEDEGAAEDEDEREPEMEGRRR